MAVRPLSLAYAPTSTQGTQNSPKIYALHTVLFVDIVSYGSRYLYFVGRSIPVIVIK
jgi:hypothetical protein